MASLFQRIFSYICSLHVHMRNWGQSLEEGRKKHGTQNLKLQVVTNGTVSWKVGAAVNNTFQKKK